LISPQNALPLISPPAGRREELASKLEHIARDLRDMNGPEFLVPTSSIEISHSYLSSMPVMTISGIAHGHPKLGTKPIATSQVFCINTDVSLVRTPNRWYRLGVPMESSPSSGH
jgi:hypothetical protein